MAILEPGKIGVMGDIHGNARWIVSQIPLICEKLEPPKIILQAGDFGVWAPPGEEKWSFAGKEHIRKSFLTAVDEALYENDAYLWFIDGNHEDHPLIERLRQGISVTDESWITMRIRHLSRGYRWEWHDRTWLAAGGAVSVDKLAREEGISWFPQEEITDEQEAFIISGGHADVVLSHDAPAELRLNLPRPTPALWLPMIPRAEEHRERLQRICVAVKPSHVFHGHYHLRQLLTVHTAWGKCRFTSLDMDGRKGNWGILDTMTMEWEW